MPSQSKQSDSATGSKPNSRETTLDQSLTAPSVKKTTVLTANDLMGASPSDSVKNNRSQKEGVAGVVVIKLKGNIFFYDEEFRTIVETPVKDDTEKRQLVNAIVEAAKFLRLKKHL